jgi:hypothetical protein
MNRQRVADESIELALSRRARGQMRATLLSDIVALMSEAPQDQSWARTIWPPSARLLWLAGAVAILLAVMGVAVVGVVLPTLNPALTIDRSVELSPTVAPTVAGSCGADGVTVAAGDAMPSAIDAPAHLPGLEGGLGVFETGVTRDGSFSADIWRVTAGQPDATRLAAIGGSGLNTADPVDISADGSQILVLAGHSRPDSAAPGCVDLIRLLVSATGVVEVQPLTMLSEGQAAIGAAISPDRQRVAYGIRLAGEPARIRLIEPATGVTVEVDGCAGAVHEMTLAWSPGGRHLAAACIDHVLAIDSAGKHAVRLATSSAILALSWLDDRSLEIASLSEGPPSRLVVARYDADTGAKEGTWTVDDSGIEWTTGSVLGLFDDARRKLALRGWSFDGTAGTESGYVVRSGLPPSVILRQDEDPLGWSGDGLVVLEEPPEGDFTMTRLATDSGARDVLGTLPRSYLDGVWRFGSPRG